MNFKVNKHSHKTTVQVLDIPFLSQADKWTSFTGDMYNLDNFFYSNIYLYRFWGGACVGTSTLMWVYPCTHRQLQERIYYCEGNPMPVLSQGNNSWK